MRLKRMAVAAALAVAMAAVAVGSVYISCDYFPWCFPF